MRVVACLLAFVSTTLAYRVLTPNAKQGWTSQGSQPLTWESATSDKPTFSVVLDNQQIHGFSPILIASKVDGTKGKMDLSPRNGRWPTGENFRVNLVASDDRFDSIYAQSDKFDIVQSTAKPNPGPVKMGPEYNATSGSLNGSGSAGAPGAANSATESTISATDQSLNSMTNSANSKMRFSSGLLGLSVLLAFVLV